MVAVSLIFYTFLMLISIIFNSTGIYFLLKVPSFLSNQKLLLMSLSLMNILVTSTDFIRRLVNLLRCRFHLSYFLCMIVNGLNWYFYFVYLFAPFVIMLDRFIGVMNPLRYKNIFPKRRVRLVVIVTWIFGLVLLIPRAKFESWDAFCPIISFVIELLVLVFIIIAYTLMAFKIRKHRQRFPGSRIQPRISKVAMGIIISFTVLVLVPEIVLAVRLVLNMESIAIADGDELTNQIYLVTTVNFIIDPVIYLYGYPPLRDAVRQIFCRRTSPMINRRQLNDVDNVQNMKGLVMTEVNVKVTTISFKADR